MDMNRVGYVLIAIVLVVVSGCSGSSGKSEGVVKGVAAIGAPLTGTVTVKDSSTPTLVKSASSDATGKFSIDITDMKAPFILQAVGTVNGVIYREYSFASDAGIANINPLSTVVLAAAAGVTDPTAVFDNPGSTKLGDIDARMTEATDSIKARIGVVLALYGVQSVDPIRDNYEADHRGLDALFDAIDISTATGSIELRNRNDDSLIFSGRLEDSSHDVMDDSKVPPPAVPADGTTIAEGQLLYAANCATCHGAIASSNRRLATSAQIQSAITANKGGMAVFSYLSPSQIQAIAAALSSP